MKLFKIFVATFILTSCQNAVAPPSPTLAVVNGKAVSLSSFQKYQSTESWRFPKEDRNSLLNAFLTSQLLLQEADKRKIDVSSEELKKEAKDLQNLLAEKGISLQDFLDRRRDELKIQKLVSEVLREKISVSREELLQFYEKNGGEFQHPEEVHVRQIVLDSESKASAVRELLVQGKSFTEVAARYSLSPDRKTGGDLGWFSKGVMPGTFDQICFSLPVGILSPIVKTPYGFHLFEVLEKRSAGREPFEEVEEKIREKLMAEKGRVLFQEWYEALKKESQVKVFEKVLAQMP